MPEIVTVGEALIDLTQTEEDEKHIRRYAAFPGGAPANVAVAVARLGAGAAFIGKVGRDTFGASIRETLSLRGEDALVPFSAEKGTGREELQARLSRALGEAPPAGPEPFVNF